MWLLALVACVGTTKTDSGTAGDSGTGTATELAAAFGVIWPDCGPADGLAYRVGIDDTTAPMSCEVGLRGGREASFYLWTNLPTASTVPDTLDLGTDYATGGTAIWCTSVDTCSDAVSGEIVFTSFVDGGPAAGTFDLTTADGQHEARSFDLTWCPHEMHCG